MNTRLNRLRSNGRRHAVADLNLDQRGTEHPLFDERWYASQLETPLKKSENALAHYLREGAARGLSPHPLFDPDWYLAQLKEPIPPGESPLEHFLREGIARGLSPHPLFDATWCKQALPPMAKPKKLASPKSAAVLIAPTMRQRVMPDPAQLERMLALAERQGIDVAMLRRKKRKLERDPEAFFADSRWALVRALGALLAKG
jgi:hypothetical protein